MHNLNSGIELNSYLEREFIIYILETAKLYENLTMIMTFLIIYIPVYTSKQIMQRR